MNKIVTLFFVMMIALGAVIVVLLGLTFIALTFTFLITTMFLVALIVFIHIKTNAFMDLTAALEKKSQAWFFGSDKTVRKRFLHGLGTKKIAEVPGVGYILVTEDSVYRDEKTGAPMAVIAGEAGITAPVHLVAAGQEFLKETKVDDLTEMVSTDEKTGLTSVKNDFEHIKTDIAGKTIRILDFLRFFIYDVTPASIKLAIEESISEGLRDARTMNFKWIIAIITIIMVSTLAVIMIMMFAPASQPAPLTPDQISAICRSVAPQVGTGINI